MSSKSEPRKNSAPHDNPRSKLAQRYHEIGIKAVAAALQNKDNAQQREAKDDYQPQKANHHNTREKTDE
jgi:hypothetical protein